MRPQYETLTNRELYEQLTAKRQKGVLEIWPVVGEMARRVRRLRELRELLRVSEDHGFDAPETKEMINEIVQTFSTYKLNGAGDQRK